MILILKNHLKKKLPINFGQKNDVIMDIGAYHGFGTLKNAEYLNSTGSIIDFEVRNKNL